VQRLEFQLGELLTNLRRNGILTLAAVMTVVSSLSILALFYLLHCNLSQLLDDQTRKAQISAFLAKGLQEAEQNQLRAKIAAIPGVEDVEFVSSQAAMERMERVMELGPEERALLGGESRLPAKFAVRPADPAAIGAIAEQLQKLAGVEEVRYQQSIVAPLNELRVRARQFGWTALLVLGLATCGIISNAIRLTLYARRREIRIMQLVGATDGFVRAPFVMEGVFHGLVGGLLALGVTSALYDQVREINENINPWLKTVTLGELMPAFAVGLVVLGVAFGAGSSLVSIRRFLREA